MLVPINGKISSQTKELYVEPRGISVVPPHDMVTRYVKLNVLTHMAVSVEATGT